MSTTVESSAPIEERLRLIFAPSAQTGAVKRHCDCCSPAIEYDRLLTVCDRLPPVLLLTSGWDSLTRWMAQQSASGIEPGPWPAQVEAAQKLRPLKGVDEAITVRAHHQGRGDGRSSVYHVAGLFLHPGGNHFTYAFSGDDGRWRVADSLESRLRTIDAADLSRDDNGLGGVMGYVLRLDRTRMDID